MTIAGSALFILMYFTSPIHGAGGDCMSDSEIQCFECNSFDDPRCHDPFIYNYTNKDAMPDTAPCNGCCVKMVQFIGTGTEKICESPNSLIFVFVPLLNIHRLFENSDELFFHHAP